MHSSLIGKIEKARRYALERDRVTFTSFKTTFRGEHDSYDVELADGKWHCTCNFFSGWGVCSHIMAIQRMFPENLPKSAQSSVDAPPVATANE
jgi:hypothetical protein